MQDYTEDYLLDKKIKILQPISGYRASTDAVILSSMVDKISSGYKILDVGSGTGAISLCLAHRFASSGVSITGLELQDELCELSNMSSKANKFENFLNYKCVDISKNKIESGFDVVVTNPPYSEKDMPSPNYSKSRAHNHHDMSLNSWLEFCIRKLKPNGKIYVINRAEALSDILNSFHGKVGEIKVVPIFSKPNQKAKRVVVIGKKTSKTPLEILEGLTVHTQESGYTTKANEILREGRGYF